MLFYSALTYLAEVTSIAQSTGLYSAGYSAPAQHAVLSTKHSTFDVRVLGTPAQHFSGASAGNQSISKEIIVF